MLVPVQILVQNGTGVGTGTGNGTGSGTDIGTKCYPV